jgi:hypothetical protein
MADEFLHGWHHQTPKSDGENVAIQLPQAMALYLHSNNRKSHFGPDCGRNNNPSSPPQSFHYMTLRPDEYY